MMESHNCSLCPFFANKQDDLVTHVVRRHQHDANFIVHCSAAACGASFSNYKSFKSHVKRCHSAIIDSSETETDDAVPVFSHTPDSEYVKSAAEAAYILSLKAKFRISQSAINAVCNSTKELFRAKLQEHTCNNACENCDIGDSVCESLFSELDTFAKQENFFKKYFGYVTPRCFNMGSGSYTTIRGKVIEKRHFGYFVPFKEQLHAVLSMPEVQQIFDSEKSSDYVYDFKDAVYLQHHPMQSTSFTLNFCIYTDEFEIVNPIGSHRKKHKITAFYWTLLNIPPEYRSKLSAIQLLAIAKSIDIRKFGINGLLHDFKNTMFELQIGVKFCMDGSDLVTFKGFLVCALADTPAAQLLGGFKEGVGSAVSPCRSCDARRSHLSNISTVAECPMRNLQEHKTRVSFLQRQSKPSYKYWSKR